MCREDFHFSFVKEFVKPESVRAVKLGSASTVKSWFFMFLMTFVNVSQIRVQEHGVASLATRNCEMERNDS